MQNNHMYIAIDLKTLDFHDRSYLLTDEQIF